MSVTAEIEGSDAQALEDSSQAVTVVEIEQERQLTADLAEVMARTQGVGIRRSGGLGSGTRFSLTGLTDDQIRFFIDGIPLDMAGYAAGIGDIPVNLVERVEIYKGVVPVRFGADALGGAVNLVTRQGTEGSGGELSLQAGFYGTRRASLNLFHDDSQSGLFARLTAFDDRSDNNYEIDVEVPNEVGRLQPATVKRFHDAYTSRGASVQLGIADRSWAEHLQLNLFTSELDKELQHNTVMTVPYGEAEYAIDTEGLSLQYRNVFNDRWSLQLAAGISERETSFLDTAELVYDWYGNPVFNRDVGGELGDPSDQVVWDDSQFLRAALTRDVTENQRLQFAFSPTRTERRGKERLSADGERDPLESERTLESTVLGIEHIANLHDDRLENTLFAKYYQQSLRSEEPTGANTFQRNDRDVDHLGWGNALRYWLNDSWTLKASYENAIRLPRPDEIFGNAAQIQDNPDLEEEESHNLNLGVAASKLAGPGGDYRAELNLFLRETDKLIVLLGADQYFRYQNVFSARAQGVEAAAGWTSPNGFVQLDGNLTWLDFRNASSQGAFGDFNGDRIPNRPYQFANTSAELLWHDVMDDFDELSLVWNTRYVHSFYRSWESVGLREFKQRIGSQTTHSLALAYRLEKRKYVGSLAAEILNLTDEHAFDFFGVQKPGRSYQLKFSLEF